MQIQDEPADLVLVTLGRSGFGPEGVAHLKALLEELGCSPVPIPPNCAWQALVGASPGNSALHWKMSIDASTLIAKALLDQRNIRRSTSRSHRPDAGTTDPPSVPWRANHRLSAQRHDLLWGRTDLDR